MELLLDDGQTLLKESAERFAEQHGGGPRARRQRKDGVGLDRARLTAVAEAGWFGLMVPEALGGSGLGAIELALVCEAAGAGLVGEPIGALAAVALALASAPPATAERWLTPLLAGHAIVLPALERSHSAGPEAEADGSGWRLTCRREVSGASASHAYLIGAPTAGGRILAVIPADATGLSTVAAKGVDGSQRASLKLDAVPVALDGLVARPDAGAAIAAATVDRCQIATAAEMLGVMDRAHHIAVDYLKLRKQFGRAIGSFQALQHRAADNVIEVETVRSLLFQVARAMDAGHGSRAHIAALKARASDAVMAVTKAAVQLHGAIGFTDEHEIGLYLRRAMVLAAQGGTAAEERARYMELRDASPS